MNVVRTFESATDTIIAVSPFPELLFGSTAYARYVKIDLVLGGQPGDCSGKAFVQYDQFSVTPAYARQYAAAILKACEIAEALERDGYVVLDGEAENDGKSEGV